MDISKIDKNFALKKLNPDDFEWHEITESEFSLHGVYYNEEKQLFMRLPEDVARATNGGVADLNRHTAGGRIRFATDAHTLAIQATIPTLWWPMLHMPMTGSHNFSFYAEKEFSCTTRFDLMQFCKAILDKEPTFSFDDAHALQPCGDGSKGWIATTPDKFRECEIAFPLYGGVKKVYIGVNKGATIRKAKPYTYQKPVVFYGSSITQGGCASHPGADHVSSVCRWLDTDYINLGFSGSARGEEAIRNYIAGLDASVFVLDYDHNAPSAEHLKETHYPLYEAIRKAHPTTPIIYITKPDIDGDPDGPKRRNVIYDVYASAKAKGDNFVWFIGGETLFDTHQRWDCMVDCCHPNDLGFYRMAKNIYPVLKEALRLTK